jgi:hypothetical protein
LVPVKTSRDVEKAAKKAVEALYGTEIQDFKVGVIFPFPNEQKRVSWDVQVTFFLNNLKYTVDLIIQQKSGEVTATRLIDTMVPI